MHIMQLMHLADL